MAVTIVELCQDEVYGDHGVPVKRFVAPSTLSPLELAVREHFEAPPNRAEDLIGVTLQGGLALILFPAGYENSPKWSNTSTAGGNRGFFPPLVETVFQFPDVQQVAMRVGSRPWWPAEDTEHEPIGRGAQAVTGSPTVVCCTNRVPLHPRPIDPGGQVAAVQYVADSLRADFAASPWYRDLQAVTWGPMGVTLTTTLGPGEVATASDIAAAVDEILNRDQARWCDINVDITARYGPNFKLRPQGFGRHVPPCER